MTLAHAIEKRITFARRVYQLDLAFDNVLRVFDLQRDWLFTPAQRLQLSVELLAGRSAARLPINEQSKLFTKIISEFINAGCPPGDPGEPRVLDFAQDAALIYASFMQAYGIDLDRERGRLDWRIFIALFQGLPEDTKIREVMSIRRREIPAPTKDNAKEIEALLKAKAFYAIKMSEEEAEQSFQAGVNRLAETLLGRAKAGV